MANHDARLDRLFAALGDPTRRALVARLTRGPASVSELAAPHDMALPSLMAHLRKLEACGLVVSRKEGRVRTCALAPDAFSPARDWMTEQSAAWTGRLDRFDDYVTKLAKDQGNGPRPQD